MSTPSSRICPSSGRSNPAIRRSVVVLPQPDGPSSEKNSPDGMSRSMPSTAATSANRFTSETSRTSPPAMAREDTRQVAASASFVQKRRGSRPRRAAHASLPPAEAASALDELPVHPLRVGLEQRPHLPVPAVLARVVGVAHVALAVAEDRHEHDLVVHLLRPHGVPGDEPVDRPGVGHLLAHDLLERRSVLGLDLGPCDRSEHPCSPPCAQAPRIRRRHATRILRSRVASRRRLQTGRAPSPNAVATPRARSRKRSVNAIATSMKVASSPFHGPPATTVRTSAATGTAVAHAVRRLPIPGVRYVPKTRAAANHATSSGIPTRASAAAGSPPS